MWGKATITISRQSQDHSIQLCKLNAVTDSLARKCRVTAVWASLTHLLSSLVYDCVFWVSAMFNSPHSLCLFSSSDRFDQYKRKWTARLWRFCKCSLEYFACCIAVVCTQLVAAPRTLLFWSAVSAVPSQSSCMKSCVVVTACTVTSTGKTYSGERLIFLIFFFFLFCSQEYPNT